jgi:RNA polymerase sigma factor (sigma-70 family)
MITMHVPNSVDRFLAQIGDRQLLSGDQERVLVQRLDRARVALQATLYRSPLVRQTICRWMDGLRDGTLMLREVVDVEATQGRLRPDARRFDDTDKTPTSSEAPARWQSEVTLSPLRDMIIHRFACGLGPPTDPSLGDDIVLQPLQIARLVTQLEALGDASESGSAARPIAQNLATGSNVQASSTELRVFLKDLKHADKEVQDARRNIVQANLRLVAWVARRYLGRGLPLADLIQEGNLGLLRAVERFNYRFGYRFSTYAVLSIRHRCIRALLNQGRLIRISTHKADEQRWALGAKAQLTARLGRSPSEREIATSLGSSARQVRTLLELTAETVSLDARVNHENLATVGDLIEDRNTITPSDAAAHSELRSALATAMGQSLTAREVEILRLRFGLGTTREHSLAEIGAKYAVTRERIRQIEAKALEKMHRHRRLAEYLCDA